MLCNSSIFSQNVWLNLDKPVGISSAKVVAIVKKITGAKKVGHGGTLDPFASGVLPIALNKATKTSEYWMQQQKKYFFRIIWGEFRDTDDLEGRLEELSLARPITAEIISVLPSFIGKILQTPSRFSAIKINGQRAYNLARKNIPFKIKQREIKIFSLRLISNCEEFADFEVECSKGTYIRSLCRDICTKLGVCGYVSKLTRQGVGKFFFKKGISLDLLKLITNYGGRFSDGSLLLMQNVLASDDLDAQSFHNLG